MRGPRPKGGVTLVKPHEFCRAWSEFKIEERGPGVPTRPQLREWCCERRKDLSRAFFSHATERGLGPRGRLPRDRCPARGPMPHTGSKGLASARVVTPVLNRCCFMAGFCENLAKYQ